MALTPQISTCVVNGCTQIKITETTGVYSPSNTGGYGPPNDTVNSFNTAVLTITSPSLVTYTIDLFPLGFPSSNPNFSYTIPVATLGLTTIEDGQWIFVYTIGDKVPPTISYTTTRYSLFYCNSECCVSKKLANLKLEDCDCCKTDTAYDDYVLTQTMLESLKNAAKCGDTSKFAKIKKIIDRLCANTNCKTCK